MIDSANLAKKLADQSLDIWLPSTSGLKDGRGKANRLETVFRTALEALKAAAGAPDEEKVSRIAGTVAKRIERLETGVQPRGGEELTKAIQALAYTVVHDVFIQRCRRSYAQLNREANRLADGVYFESDLQLSERWSTFRSRAKKEEQQ